MRRLHKEYDVDLMDLDYVWAILRGLPQDWSLVIMTLQPDQNEWTLDNILARLRQEELRRTKLAGDSAFFVRRQGGRPTSMRGKGKGIGQKHASPKQKESKEKGPKPQMARFHINGSPGTYHASRHATKRSLSLLQERRTYVAFL